ncbi:MAG TPA: hypothetical protein VFV20_09950, partial [Candidatus Limnocylindria bacterium]|nr:hypothetical protein [Candidatus Limnocylindria bacterium]
AGLKVSLAHGDTDRAPAEIRHALYELHALTRLHFVDELRTCRNGTASLRAGASRVDAEVISRARRARSTAR